MNAREHACHDYIKAILDQAHRKELDYHDVLYSIEPTLRSYRPRCPKCSGVVDFTPWFDELRAARCGRCSHTWKEAL